MGLKSGVAALLIAQIALGTDVLVERQTALEALIVNNCPGPIDVFQSQVFEGTLQRGANFTKPTTGLWYTNANGGGTTRGLMRGGAFSRGFYYMVRDGEKPLNTGMRIAPLETFGHDGYCAVPTCNTNTCGGAFPFPPTRFPDPDAPVAPPVPYFQCAEAKRYQITFCPSGEWPGDGSVEIHPNFHSDKCLDVRGAVFANGTPVQIYDCNGTPAQKWELRRSLTKIKLAGTDFCLDAGSSPANGVGMKIWQCFDGLAAQDWSFLFDRQIRLQASTGNGLCLDLENGNVTNTNKVQTWECNSSNPNQVWSANLG